jgi:hypothetical protein
LEAGREVKHPDTGRTIAFTWLAGAFNGLRLIRWQAIPMTFVVRRSALCTFGAADDAFLNLIHHHRIDCVNSFLLPPLHLLSI